VGFLVRRQDELTQLRGVEAVFAGPAVTPAGAEQLAHDLCVDHIELAAVALRAADHVFAGV